MLQTLPPPPPRYTLTQAPDAPPCNLPHTCVLGPARYRRLTLSESQREVLVQWLQQNRDDPYPDAEEKRRLCRATGLDAGRLDRWLINWRRRDRKRRGRRN